MLNQILSQFRLNYLNHSQEQEYIQLKMPFTKEFFKVLCGCLTLFFIPLTLRLYLKNLFPQTYVGLGLFILSVIVFLLRNRFAKYMQIVNILFISIVLVMAIYNSQLIVSRVGSIEAFYMGNTVALINRLVDFRVSEFRVVLSFNLVFNLLKFLLIRTDSWELVCLILCLEAFPTLLSFKSEKADRWLFESIWKSKNQLLKFKQLLTDYLPNPLAILASDYTSAHFVNNSFTKLFKCKDVGQAKASLATLVLENQKSQENRALLDVLGYPDNDEDGHKPIKLSQIMELIANKKEVIKSAPVLSFQVVEHSHMTFHRSWTSRSIGRRTYREEGSQGDMKIVSPERITNLSHCEKGISSVNRSEEICILDKFGLDTEPNKVVPRQRTSLFCQKHHLQTVEEPEGGEDRDIDNRDLRRRVFKVTMFSLPWDDDEAIALVFDDVTHERTIMELKIADKNKDLVIAMVSHELRTPLNGMLGLLEMVRKEVVRPDVISNLNACKTSGRLLLNLVNSILDFSQINNKKLKLLYTRVSISDLLTEIRSLFDHYCQVKGLFFHIDIDSRVPKTVVTDQTRLSQILINLLGNAFKFTFRGGVTLSVNAEEGNPYKMIFSVEDTGIGIKHEDQEKLFKLFGRLEQQDKNINTHGVGLGLTISNNLVKLLNPIEKRGIQVDSEEGVGTIFSFAIQSEQSEENKDAVDELEELSCDVIDEKTHDLPVLERMATYSDMREIQGSNASSPLRAKPKVVLHHFDSRSSVNCVPGDGEIKISYTNLGDSLLINNMNVGRRISNFAMREEEYHVSESKKEIAEESQWCLLVDDNPFNLMVATSIMKERGYKVLTALNGQEAINKVKQHHENAKELAIILMDCQMPLIDGYEATKILRGMMREGEVPECNIVALTANNQDEEHEKQCNEAGMNGTLAKPLKVKELDEILQKVAKGKRLSDKRPEAV